MTNISEMIIGEIVVPSYKQCNQENAREQAKALNLESLLNMPRCNTRNVLGKAVKAANRKYREFEITQVHEGPDKVQFVVVRKEVRDRGMDYDGNVLKDPNVGVEARFYFSKKSRDEKKPASQCVDFFENPNHQVARYVYQEYFNQAVIFTSDDMRRSANNLLMSIGAMQITRGNAWFVPKQVKGIVDSLDEWLVSSQSYVARYTQLDIDNTREHLSKTCEDGLTSALVSLKNQIATHKAEASTRTSTLEKRVSDLKQMRTHCELYSSSIGANLDSMLNDIQQCEKDLVDFICCQDNK